MCTPSASFFHYFLSVHYLYIFYAVKPYIIIIIIIIIIIQGVARAVRFATSRSLPARSLLAVDTRNYCHGDEAYT